MIVIELHREKAHTKSSEDTSEDTLGGVMGHGRLEARAQRSRPPELQGQLKARAHRNAYITRFEGAFIRREELPLMLDTYAHFNETLNCV